MDSGDRESSDQDCGSVFVVLLVCVIGYGDWVFAGRCRAEGGAPRELLCGGFQ